MTEVQELMGIWRETPPPHIVLACIASVLGVDFGSAGPEPEHREELDPMGGMSIAELSIAIQQPKAGQETLSASLEALRLLSNERPSVVS